MAMLNKLRLRLRALFFKSKMEEELDKEVLFHLEREIEENIARGMSQDEAKKNSTKVQELTDKVIKEVDATLAQKEAEINKV